MKTVLLLTSIFCLAAATQFIESSSSSKITGVIINGEGAPVAGAEIFLYNTRKGTQTDPEGYFELMVHPESEKISIYHPLYESKTVEISNKPMKIKLSVRKGGLAGVTTMNKDIRVRGTSPSSTPSVIDMESPMTMESDISIDEVVVTGFSDDDMSMKSEGHSMSHTTRRESPTMTSMKRKAKERAGQLTAGEWNDLNNWEAWNKLVNETDYKEMSEYWKIGSKERISVFVMNQYELPIADCVVTLKQNGEIIWTAKTDNAGKAELWSDENFSSLSLDIKSSRNSKVVRSVKKMDEGVNIVRLEENCNAPMNAEVMFVVDATGSMGDEIEFLKSELSDVIDQVEASRTDVDFKWGSVFYRDDSDHYLTRQSPLSSKSKRVLDFIDMQSAGGGGDYPEAVNEGLEEALLQEWSEDAIARIVFLILDAPPHHDADVLQDLESQIAFAAAMGIKIIPITASGINRQTEYLMKFMSIMTNGTYVFLTDHSGIGGKHLDPITKDFEVEKLNDLLIRVIGHYTDPGTCTRQEDEDPLSVDIEIFPNPTTDFISVSIPKGVEKVTLTTSSGMVISSILIADQDLIKLDLSAYVDGMYFVNTYHGESIQTYKIIKSNKV